MAVHDGVVPALSEYDARRMTLIDCISILFARQGWSKEFTTRMTSDVAKLYRQGYDDGRQHPDAW